MYILISRMVSLPLKHLSSSNDVLFSISCWASNMVVLQVRAAARGLLTGASSLLLLLISTYPTKLSVGEAAVARDSITGPLQGLRV